MHRQIEHLCWPLLGLSAKSDRSSFLDVYIGSLEDPSFHHEWYKDPSPMPHMLQALQELRNFVDSLDERKLHALVATEL